MCNKIIFYIAFLSGILCSCNNASISGTAAEGDTLIFKYARHISMIKYDGYTKVELLDPWHEGKILHRYYLTDKSCKEQFTDGDRVDIPVKKSVVFNSAHCYLMYQLGCQKSIIGVCDLKYINNADLQHRAKINKITDCGDGMAPMIEKIIDCKPQVLLISPFENNGGFGKLDKLDIPVIQTADYMETSALGRAEWMKFYGLLFGYKAQADSMFNVVDSTYNSLRHIAIKLPRGRSILTERKTGSVWYTPGGASSMGAMFRDANATYAFANDKHSGSLALTTEEIIDKAGYTDVWAFKYMEHPLSKSDLIAEYHGYNALKAFRTGEIYECNSTKTPYFDEISFHPDYLLRDLIQLVHSGIRLGGLRYYKKL